MQQKKHSSENKNSALKLEAALFDEFDESLEELLTDQMRAALRTISLGYWFLTLARPANLDEILLQVDGILDGEANPPFSPERRDTLRKAFERIREKLKTVGLVIAETGSKNQRSWFVDTEQSFTKLHDLDEKDAFVLYVLGSAALQNPSFKAKSALRSALIKIRDIFPSTRALPLQDEVSHEQAGWESIVEVLCECIAQKVCCKIEYARANNSRIKRVVAPIKIFSQNNKLYVACAEYLADEKSLATPHTYRLDRFLKLPSKTKLSFEQLLQDMPVSEDNFRLPLSFEFGPEDQVPKHARLYDMYNACHVERLKELASKHRRVVKEEKQCALLVDYYDLHGCAAWALANGLIAKINQGSDTAATSSSGTAEVNPGTAVAVSPATKTQVEAETQELHKEQLEILSKTRQKIEQVLSALKINPEEALSDLAEQETEERLKSDKTFTATDKIKTEPDLSALPTSFFDTNEDLALRIGRPKTDHTVRDCMILLQYLSRTRGPITVEAICSTLDCSYEDAQLALILLQNIHTFDQYLPIYNEGSSWYIESESKYAGEALRLSRSETEALLHALEISGLKNYTSTSIAQSLIASLSEGEQAKSKHDPSSDKATPANPKPSETLPDNDLGKSSDETSDLLPKLVSSLYENPRHELVINYRKESSDTAEKRHIVPLRVQVRNRLWYLLAWCNKAQALRTFRVDRITKLQQGESVRLSELKISPRDFADVDLVFTQEAQLYLSLFDWPGLKIDSNDDGLLWGSIPYLQTDWLWRSLAACGGSILPRNRNYLLLLYKETLRLIDQLSF